MKQLAFLIIIFLVASCKEAPNYNIKERRHIAVTGSAEVIVQPDEIELEIKLKEYGSPKIQLSDIDKEFRETLKQHGISENQILYSNPDLYWYSWWHYRNDSYKQVSYTLKLNSTTDFLGLVQSLNFDGVHTLKVSNSTNKELQKLRKDIKIAAIKAAKDKAQYLLESIDEKVGKAITIVEVPDSRNNNWRGSQNLMSNVSIASSPSNDGLENVATIKLRYEVKATFEID